MKDLPSYLKKYAWLLGQFIQNYLLKIEGIRKLKVEELKVHYPELNIGELINKQRELYGVYFDWDSLECYVKYKGKKYNITDEIIEIVIKNTDKDFLNNIGVDTRGFDIITAFKEATNTIISRIIKE